MKRLALLLTLIAATMQAQTPTTANLWVDTNGGTCTRQSSPGAWVDAQGCSSMQAAQTAASAGDTVIIKNGTYGAQNISSGGKASVVSFFAETSGSVLIGNLTISVDRIHITGVISSGSQNTRTDLDVEGSPSFTDVTIDGWRGKTVFINSSNTTLKNADIGDADECGASREDAIRIQQSVSGDPTNIKILNSSIHDFYKHANGCDANHADGLQVCCAVSSIGGITLDGNKFYNNDTSNIMAESVGGTWTVQNNYFGATVYGGDNVDIGRGTCTGITYRNNVVTGSVLLREQTCSQSGNINNNIAVDAVASNGCAGWDGPTFVGDHNIFPAGGSTCGTNAKRCTPTWLNGVPSSSNGYDIRLSAADTCAKDYSNASFPPTDLYGTSRPQGSTADAGAFEIVTTNLTVSDTSTYQVMDGMGVNLNANDWNGGDGRTAIDYLVDTLGANTIRVVSDPMCWLNCNSTTIPTSTLTLLAGADSATMDTVYGASATQMQNLWNTISYLNSKGIKGNQILVNFMGYVPAWIGAGNLTIINNTQTSGASAGQTVIDSGNVGYFGILVASLVYYGRVTKGLDFTLVEPANESASGGGEGYLATAAQLTTIYAAVANCLNGNTVNSISCASISPASVKAVKLVGGGTNPTSGAGGQYASTLEGNSTVNAQLGFIDLHNYPNLSWDTLTAPAGYGHNWWVSETQYWCTNCDTTGTTPAVTDDWAYAVNSFQNIATQVGGNFKNIQIWEGVDSHYWHDGTNGWSAWGLIGCTHAVQGRTFCDTGTFAVRRKGFADAIPMHGVRAGMQRIGPITQSLGLTNAYAFEDKAKGTFSMWGQNATGSPIVVNGQLSGTIPSVSTLQFYLTNTNTNTGNFRQTDVAVSAQTFTATVPANNLFLLQTAPVVSTYSISGVISGAGGNAATVNLTGAATASTIADASGNYTFSGLTGSSGPYTVTPSKTGYTFSPASIGSINIAAANITGQNFTSALAAIYSISGTVTFAAGSTDPDPVTINLTGTSTGSTTTDGSGNFTFSSLTNGNYTVTPSKATYTFAPVNRAVTISGANQTAQNFTATGTPAVTFAPSSWDFGNQGIGVTSTGKVFSLGNAGTADLSITSISITGTNAGNFSRTDNSCPPTIPGGTHCNPTITFTPSTSGVRSANLQVVDNAAGSPHIFALSGTGIPAPVPACTPSGGSYKSARLVTCTNQIPTVTMCWKIGSQPATDGAGNCTVGSGTFLYPPSGILLTSSGTLYVTGTQAGNTDNTVSYAFTINPSWTAGWVMQKNEAGSTKFGGVTSLVTLPQNWVNSKEWVGTTSNTVNFPTGWTCGATHYPVPSGDYANTQAGLQQAINDAETCRTANSSGTQINIPGGTTYSGTAGLTLPQTAGDSSGNFIVLQSTTPLTTGRTVCSHGIQDNVAASTQPGMRNLGCDGSMMSYQLGTAVTPINYALDTLTSTGNTAFTLANGTNTNTSAYNDVASMYTIECTLATCNGINTAANDANNIGPHHFAILNAEVRLKAGITLGVPIKLGDSTESISSQRASHIHIAYSYIHGDWSDAPVSGGVATATITGTNSIANTIGFNGCINCSVSYSYLDKMIRPGAEGHGIWLGLWDQIKVVHNWVEGQSITMFSGGFGGTVSLVGWANDEETRGNRFTYPYSWLLAANAGFRPNGNMTSTGAGTGATFVITGLTAGAITSVHLRAGGSGYSTNDVLTLVQPGFGSNATVTVTSVTGGSVTGVSLTSGGSGYQYGSWVHKNSYEHKVGNRMLDDGNINENVDNSGAQNGIVASWKSDNGEFSTTNNPWYQIKNLTRTNGIARNACQGLSWGFRAQNTGTGTMGGITQPVQFANFSNNLAYNIGLNNPNCSSANGGWSFRVNIAGSGTEWAASCTRDGAGATTTCTLTGMPVGDMQTNFVVGDPVTVLGCTDTSFNTNQNAQGPSALAGTVPTGLTVVYTNSGTPNAVDNSGTCKVRNGQGYPRYLTHTHNSDFVNGTEESPFNTAGNGSTPYQMARNISFTNDVFVSAGFSSAWGEGTSTETKAFDPASLVVHDILWPGRDSAVTCTGHTAGAGGMAACYTEYSNTSVASTPTTLYGVPTSYCIGNDPTTGSCVGVLGAMSAGTFPTVLNDWHNYRLCHTGDAACNSKASKYAAGGANDGSDGADLGADLSKIDAAQTSSQYPGGYPD